MRSITEKPTGNGGDLSTEQSARFDALKAELDGVEKRLARQSFIDEAERKMQGQTIVGNGDHRLDDAMRDFSLRRAIASQIPELARQVDCGRELELSSEVAKRSGRTFQGLAVPLSVFHVEKRTITSSHTSPDFGGANFVGTDHLGNQFIDVVRAKLITRRLGARTLSDLRGDVEIPKMSASASAQWIAEDTELGDGDPTFQKITLEPKHVGAMTEFSRNMLLQSSPDIEQIIRMDFASVLANALDIAALNGSGSTQPTGVLNLSGLATVSGPVSWAKILEMIETLEEANTEGTDPAGRVHGEPEIRARRARAARP